MARINRILAPTDFSAAAEQAVRYAFDLAAREGAAIHLLHVIGDLALTAAYAEALAIELPGLRESLVADAQRRLDQMVAAAHAAPVAITTGVLVGRVPSVITGEAADRGADLIVMGAHGRGGLAHGLLGSVTERVIRTAPCSVLTVRDTSPGARQASLTSPLARDLEF